MSGKAENWYELPRKPGLEKFWHGFLLYYPRLHKIRNDYPSFLKI